MRRAALALVAAALLAGCSGDGDESGSADGGGGTALTVEVTGLPELGGGGRRLTLACDPPGGTHPNPREACAALDADRDALRPVPRDATCSEEDGGPQRALVTGTLEGEPVEARLSRANGCEIDRWSHLRPLLDVG